MNLIGFGCFGMRVFTGTKQFPAQQTQMDFHLVWVKVCNTFEHISAFVILIIIGRHTHAGTGNYDDST